MREQDLISIQKTAISKRGTAKSSLKKDFYDKVIGKAEFRLRHFFKIEKVETNAWKQAKGNIKDDELKRFLIH